MVTGQIVLTQGTYLYTAIGQQAMRQDASALGKLICSGNRMLPFCTAYA